MLRKTRRRYHGKKTRKRGGIRSENIQNKIPHITYEHYNSILMEYLEEIDNELIALQIRTKDLTNSEKKEEEEKSKEKMNIAIGHMIHLREQKTGRDSLIKLKEELKEELQRKKTESISVRQQLNIAERPEPPRITRERLERIEEIQEELKKIEDRLQTIYAQNAKRKEMHKQKRAELVERAKKSHSYNLLEPRKSAREWQEWRAWNKWSR